MDQRSLFSQSEMPEMENEQITNCQSSHPRLSIGTSSFMLPPENLTARELNSSSYPTTSLYANALPLPNISPEIPTCIADHSRTMPDPYLNPLSASNSACVQPYYAPLGPCYNQVGAGGVSATANPQVDYGRASHKRKFPSASDVNRNNLSGCCGAGSSSNSSISTEYFRVKHMYWPHDYRSNIMPTEDEGSARNVRSRHGSTPHLETVQSAAHSALPQVFHLGPETSEPIMPAQWSHNPVSFDSHALANSSGLYTEQHLSFCAQNGNPAGGLMTAFSSYDQRPSFRATESCPSTGIAANMEEARLPRFEVYVPPRCSRPLSIVGHSTERNGRVRTRYERFQPFSDSPTRVRWMSGGVTLMDRASFYNSRNLYDQHRDMRLDIDNMGYEELLALEERIGYVSTGLSEDAVSRCLMETIYCSSGGNQDKSEEDKCAICLEEYQSEDRLGRLKCGHDFHSDCIRRWLLIKNVCPICKVAALEDELNEK